MIYLCSLFSVYNGMYLLIHYAYSAPLHFAFFSFFFKHLFILAPPGLCCSIWTLIWCIWDLVPWPVIEPGPSALRAQSYPLDHQGTPCLFSEKWKPSLDFALVKTSTKVGFFLWRQSGFCKMSLKSRAHLYLNEKEHVVGLPACSLLILVTK